MSAGDVITAPGGQLADHFVLESAYSERLVPEIKRVPGARWIAKRKHWRFPATLVALDALDRLSMLFRIPHDTNAQELAKSLREQACFLQDLSSAKTLDGRMSLVTDEWPFLPFQPVAVAYALSTRRCLIADKMGLGKTLEALAAIHLLKAYPCLIVCKTSAVGHWEREIAKWLPVPAGDIEIATWSELSGTDPEAPIRREYQGLIVDESHMAKSRHAKRTNALLAISRNIPTRLLLSGTPVLNRPADLITQLNILGRLDAVGGFWHFAKRFCAGHEGRWGWDLTGASNLDELARLLRSTCMVAREKKGPNGVLDSLPEKRREQIVVELDQAARAEYAEAERDVIAWVRREHGSGRALAAMTAEALVRLGVLRRLAAEAKAAQVVAWARDFIEDSGPEEKLVIFYHHRAVGERIVEGLRASQPESIVSARLSGDMPGSEREQQLLDFKGKKRVLVASLLTGGESIDLTCASTVVLVELPWTPAALEQAEDRLHRIGQSNPVIAYHFIARGTIDEWMQELLETKRAVVLGAEGSLALPMLERIAAIKGGS